MEVRLLLAKYEFLGAACDSSSSGRWKGRHNAKRKPANANMFADESPVLR
jgi:hypothetical protein